MTGVVETFEPLNSSHIQRVEYDPDALTARVTFQDGDVYLFSGVPVETYRRWTLAPSAGQFFKRQVEGIFNYEEQ